MNNNPSKITNTIGNKNTKWYLAIILLCILLFTLIGIGISIKNYTESNFSRTIIIFITLCLIYFCLNFISIYNHELFKLNTIYKLEIGFFYPIAFFFTSLMIKNDFIPILTFIFFNLSWIFWVVYKYKTINNDISILNCLILFWITFSIILTVGQILGYTQILVDQIYQFSIFLDFRLSMSIVIMTWIIINAMSKINSSEIETKDLLKRKVDDNQFLSLIIDILFVILNSLLRILWWLGKYLFIWAQKIILHFKEKINEIKDSLFDIIIITLNILSVFFISKYSNFLVDHYLIHNNFIDEFLPFLICLLWTGLILISLQLSIRMRFLKWENRKIKLNSLNYEKSEKKFRFVLSFPILTSGISGIFLFVMNYFNIIQLEYFKNFGIYSLLLSVSLVGAIIYAILKEFYFK